MTQKKLETVADTEEGDLPVIYAEPKFRTPPVLGEYKSQFFFNFSKNFKI